jgi:HNH endonuclease
MARKRRESRLTVERLRECLNYDPATGVFTYRIKRRGVPFGVGDKAGCVSSSTGHVVIRIDGELHMAHRLAWLHVHGRWPIDEIDHIDLNGANNAMANLREASHQENLCNQSKSRRNTSGYKWVTWQANAWLAQVSYKGKNHYIGRFSDPAEAHEEAKKLAAKLHGKFYRSI